MKQHIKINFADFWNGFQPKKSLFFRVLSKHFELELCSDPDFLIYSSFGKRHLQHRGIRIFYTGENLRPDFTSCDYAFTFDYNDHPNHLRLPLYGLEREPERLIKPSDFDAERVLSSKTRFCNFVYGNPCCVKRNRFFRKLSKYKRVDSGGRLFNNMDRVYGNIREKLELIQHYKFTFAFENESYPGYTTEKIVHPMRVNSLPIYWGNPLVHLDFNRHSFVNYFDFDNEDDVIDRIIELDQDDDLYLECLRQPWFTDNQPTGCFDRDRLLARFQEIFATPKTPVAVSGHYNLAHHVQRLSRAWHEMLGGSVETFCMACPVLVDMPGPRTSECGL